jgi:hypothetical protein
LKNDKKIQIIVDNTPVLFLSLFLLTLIGRLRYDDNCFNSLFFEHMLCQIAGTMGLCNFYCLQPLLFGIGHKSSEKYSKKDLPTAEQVLFMIYE